MDSTKIIAEQRLLYWAQFIQDRKASGLSIRAFCENAGVRENTYYYWQKRVRDEVCEQFLMSQMDDRPAPFTPKGFTEVMLHGGDDCEIIIHNEVPIVADIAAVADNSVSQTKVVGAAPSVAADIATASKITPISPAAYLLPTNPTTTTTSNLHTTEQAGQIRIEIGDIKILADALYPMDKLTKILKGLVRA